MIIKHVKFHHYGLAVKNFDKAILFHRNLGYTVGDEVYDELQNVFLILCVSKNFPNVELVRPADNKSPIDGYLNKSNEIIYHTCYELDTNNISINEFFADNRFICVSKSKPAILFNNRLVSFYYLSDVGLIEILEK